MKLDALGNEVVIGRRYGMARNTNGITKVVVGKALRETEKGLITIEIDSYRTFVGDNLCDSSRRASSTISCLGCNLFPVEEIVEGQ